MSEWFDAEQHVERAHELFEAGRWDEAESALREAIRINPYQAEWHFNLGLTLEASGRMTDAVEAFRTVSELEPEDAQATLMMGICQLKADDPRAAVESLERAGKLDPTGVGSFVHRIDAYARLGQHDQAELMFYMGQQVAGDDPELYVALADSLLDRKLHDKAVWCLREAIRLDPTLPRVQARLADAYAATNRLERARQLYLRELRRDPGDIETLLDLGCLLVDMHRYTEAGEKFRRVLEMEPDNPDAHFQLGQLALTQGRHRTAVTHFDIVLRLDPSFPQARRKMAELLLTRGRQEELHAVREMLRDEVEDQRVRPERYAPEDLDELGGLLLDAHMPGEAARVFEALVRVAPDKAEAWHYLSLARFQQGDRAAGSEAARKALEIDPKHVGAMHNLAIAAISDRRWTRARYWLNMALRIDPDDGSLRRLRLKLRFHAFVELFSWAASGRKASGLK